MAPQICSMNNRFHSEAKLPWSYDHPLANHIATNKSSTNREMPLFSRFYPSFGYLRKIFPPMGLKYSLYIVYSSCNTCHSVKFHGHSALGYTQRKASWAANHGKPKVHGLLPPTHGPWLGVLFTARTTFLQKISDDFPDVSPSWEICFCFQLSIYRPF